jgi:hypothetical protein
MAEFPIPMNNSRMAAAAIIGASFQNTAEAGEISGLRLGLHYPFDEQWADSGETLAFIPWSHNKRLIPPAPLPIYTRQIGAPRANPSAQRWRHDAPWNQYPHPMMAMAQCRLDPEAAALIDADSRYCIIWLEAVNPEQHPEVDISGRERTVDIEGDEYDAIHTWLWTRHNWIDGGTQDDDDAWHAFVNDLMPADGTRARPWLYNSLRAWSAWLVGGGELEYSPWLAIKQAEHDASGSDKPFIEWLFSNPYAPE